MTDQRWAAFVISHPYVDALACFREPIKRLADEGWHVDLFTRLSPQHPAPSFGRASVRLIPFDLTRSSTAGLMARLVSHRPKYDWIFAVPQWSLHYAGIAASLARIPMACISDELTSDAEVVSAEQKKWKHRERRAHQQCAFTIALSDGRAAFIRDENRLGADHPIYVVPNSAPGPSVRLASRYYQDTLGVAAQHRVLLHAGGWGWKVAFPALADVAARWDRRTVLVFQGRMTDDRAAHVRHPNLRFSSTVLPSDLLDYVTSSAHIGLALYQPLTANHREVGTASGKIGLYMKNALPVIATAQPSFAWIEREECGVCVSDIADIDGAVDRIWSDYNRYVANVKRCYDERFDFARAFEPVLARLEKR